MRRISDKEREKLSAEIAGLESPDLNLLRARWKLLYEIEAPSHLSRDLLRRAVAYWIQENVLGGLKPATRRLLERVAEDARARKPTKVVPLRKVGPNTILIREWGGTRHEVTGWASRSGSGVFSSLDETGRSGPPREPPRYSRLRFEDFGHGDSDVDGEGCPATFTARNSSSTNAFSKIPLLFIFGRKVRGKFTTKSESASPRTRSDLPYNRYGRTS